jgi:DNA-binding XRE family transcriptional regulator
MEKKRFVFYRKHLGLTQKELAQMLATSIKAVHSYEQGWRKIPENVERQLLFLILTQKPPTLSSQNCWVVKKCPPDRKKNCPAWKFKAGHLCWFINGTICEGVVHKNWSEKIQICKECKIFKPIWDL